MATESDVAPSDEEDEPPVREFADRGTLWLLATPINVQRFLALLSPDIADKLDFTKAERINRSFIPADLHKQEADLVYRVPFKQGRREVWIYLLLEHQSRPDRYMPLRLLSYMMQIWLTRMRQWEDNKTPARQRELPAVVPIVFYTGKRKWKTPLSFPNMMALPKGLEGFVPQFSTLFLNLMETDPGRLRGSALASVLKALQGSAESQESLARLLSEVAEEIASLPEGMQVEQRRALTYLYLLVRHVRSAEEQQHLFEVLDEALEGDLEQEGEESKMTGAQVLLAQGRKEGRKEGILEGIQEGILKGAQKGREEGLRELLLAQMTFKFGVLPLESIAAVEKMAEPELIALGQRVLTAKDLAELNLE